MKKPWQKERQYNSLPEVFSSINVPTDAGFWKKLKKHHMLHHYAEPDRGYGVSSDFWDRIFGSTFHRTNEN